MSTTPAPAVTPATTPATTPDLSFYFVIHRALRASAAQLEAAVHDLDPAERARTAALARWFEGFAGELHHHHVVEDEIFFPALAARVPTYAAHAPGIAADHAELEDLLGELVGTLRAVARGEDRAGDAARLATALRAHLDEHLALEDEEILPLFARHFGADEYDALHQASMKRLKPKEAAFTCPWLMASLSGDERQAMLATAPLPLKLMWYATRRRYARRTRIAFRAG